MDMDNAKVKKESHLELKLSSFRESKKRLKLILERVQHLELKLSGDRITDLKDEKICDADDIKESIISDFNALNSDFNYIIDELSESTSHLEELI